MAKNKIDVITYDKFDVDKFSISELDINSSKSSKFKQSRQYISRVTYNGKVCVIQTPEIAITQYGWFSGESSYHATDVDKLKAGIKIPLDNSQPNCINFKEKFIDAVDKKTKKLIKTILDNAEEAKYWPLKKVPGKSPMIKDKSKQQDDKKIDKMDAFKIKFDLDETTDPDQPIIKTIFFVKEVDEDGNITRVKKNIRSIDELDKLGINMGAKVKMILHVNKFWVKSTLDECGLNLKVTHMEIEPSTNMSLRDAFMDDPFINDAIINEIKKEINSKHDDDIDNAKKSTYKKVSDKDRKKKIINVIEQESDDDISEPEKEQVNHKQAMQRQTSSKKSVHKDTTEDDDDEDDADNDDGDDGDDSDNNINTKLKASLDSDDDGDDMINKRVVSDDDIESDETDHAPKKQTAQKQTAKKDDTKSSKKPNKRR
jgi:hypothetical protein